MKRTALALVLVLAVIGGGCQSTPYGKAIQLALDVTDTLHTGADTVDQLQKSGAMTVNDERIALNVMLALNTADTTYGACVERAHIANGKAAQFLVCANTFSTAINNPAILTQIRIINPNTQAKVMAIDTAASTLVNSAILAIESLQGKGQ